MYRFNKSHLAIVLSVLGAACSSDASGPKPQIDPPAPPPPSYTTISATGDISAKVQEFRTLLGDPNNGGTVGPSTQGRREISWDGAAANPFDNRNDFPAAFFNTNAKLGAVFTTPGTGFRNDSTTFVDINAEYANEFKSFSPTKIFSPIGSNVMDVDFQLAGQPTPALVTGFGVVFSDVDVANQTTIEFFDQRGVSLGKVAAPVRSDAAGFSFVGAKFQSAIVARARIVLGNAALGAGVNDISAGGAYDLVVTDNFIYGEPQPLQ